MFELTDKVIIITGASSGIGRACAIECSKMGAKVILIGRSEMELSNTLSLMIPGYHLSVCQDITKYEELEGMIDYIVRERGKINGFIHSAGTEIVLPLKMMSVAQYDKLFSVNVWAAFELTKQIVKQKNICSDGGSIIYISSVAGIKAEAAKIAYSSSKAALIRGAQSIALEYASRKIRVNTISPAVCVTKMSQMFLEKLSDEAKQSVIDKHPLGLGKPEDVAYACIFLLSDESRWITGTNLIVDGGYCAK